MWRFYHIVKGNYLQYARSYSFLLTVAGSLFIAFGIIPSPEANYVTMKFGNFTGAYNSAWIGMVSALLASILLSMFGYFLISGSIKRDIDSRIGQIIGTTRVTNYTYILTKIICNFLILLSILGIIFVVSIILFFLYSNGYPFELSQFILPYIFIAVPTLFIVASAAVFLEVLFPNYRILQYGVYLVLFFTLLFSSTVDESTFSTDVLGVQFPTQHLSEQIAQKFPDQNVALTVGLVAGKISAENKVPIEPLSFPTWFFISRMFWIIFALVLGYIASKLFHRFDTKERKGRSKTTSEIPLVKKAGFQLKNMSHETEFTTSLTPLIKAEVVLMMRKNNRWVWALTLIGMIAMGFVSSTISHQFILPIVWFLQVAIWSDIVSKDYTLRTHYFTSSSYKPLSRLFVSRIVAGNLLALFIAFPLLIKVAMSGDFTAFINIILGALFIVLLAVFLGALTQSRKLFEVLFFFIVYCNLNLVAITDYFGAVHSTMMYSVSLAALNLILFASAFLLKLRHERQ
ncbi:MAG: hypothetical protein P1U56_06765 [Saprospiraceae bacterium]|nr:hypothetical protein [Saprospiraceae bacterium]